MQHPWLPLWPRCGPAMLGLLGVTALAIARQSFANWGYFAIGIVALLPALRTRVDPFAILVAGAAVGLRLGFVGI
jgi:bacteriorhodopsin